MAKVARKIEGKDRRREMPGSGTMTQVIKGLRDTSQLPGIQYAQLPRSSSKGTALVSRHASRR
jgi:hypothetical protein